MRLSEQRAYEKERDQALQHIADKYQKSGLRAQYTDRVCRSRVAASEVADIDSFHFAQNIGSLEISKQISDRKTQNSKTYHHFPPLDRYGYLLFFIFSPLTHYEPERCAPESECISDPVLEIAQV